MFATYNGLLVGNIASQRMFLETQQMIIAALGLGNAENRLVLNGVGAGDIVRCISSGELMMVINVCSGTDAYPENSLKVVDKDGQIRPVEAAMFFKEHAFELVSSLKDQKE